ncbi:morphogenetic protein [Klebsiella variicola]|uniref:morphogenetic protein n=1 Tax=Klebsiella variicola TaxID=244366 RepID=UPI002FF801D6
MREKGLIFNSEMVRAILDGRKTQTRRPVKFPVHDKNLGCDLAGNELAGELSAGNYLNSAFGKPGDRIWVRETFQGPLFDYEQMDAYLEDSYRFETPEFCQYAADGGHRPEYQDADDNLRHGWRPSIHMPRWASRILLEITDVRVERLNTISPEDAESEGLECTNFTGFGDEPGLPSYPEPDVYFDPLKKQWKEYPPEAFAGLWESIYGEGSWQANPWVWVIEFKRVEGGAA